MRILIGCLIAILILTACNGLPSPTPTVPSASPTPGPPTPLPSPTVLPPAEHDINAWHPTTAEIHHSHGVDPLSTIFADFIAEFFPAHGLPIIGHPWVTSAHENAWPDGKHDGFLWFYEADTGCDQFNPGGGMQPGPCITAYLLQVHSMRTGVEIRTRFHSESLLALVCQVGGGEPCGIVYTGGWADYGVMHTSYKREVCAADPANPSLPPSIILDQPPYRTVIGSNRQGFFWSSLINSLAAQYYDPVPSNILEVAWNDLGVFSSPAAADCFNPAADQFFPNNMATQHQVFSIYLHLDEGLPRDTPLWTDVHGNLRADCANVMEAGCVPLWISSGVPDGTAYLNREVKHGNAAAAPIFDYYNGYPVEPNLFGYDH